MTDRTGRSQRLSGVLAALLPAMLMAAMLMTTKMTMMMMMVVVVVAAVFALVYNWSEPVAKPRRWCCFSVNKAGARSASVRRWARRWRCAMDNVTCCCCCCCLPSVQAAREKAMKRRTGGTGRGTSVTWCSTVSQPVRLYQGDTQSQVSK